MSGGIARTAGESGGSSRILDANRTNGMASARADSRPTLNSINSSRGSRRRDSGAGYVGAWNFGIRAGLRARRWLHNSESYQAALPEER